MSYNGTDLSVLLFSINRRNSARTYNIRPSYPTFCSADPSLKTKDLTGLGRQHLRTYVSVFLTVGLKCTLAATHAAAWSVTVSE